jgi:glutaredoxin
MDAILYTRKGCHLCDEARNVLVRHGVSVTPIDIDEHPQLRARFDYCIPVVEVDGKIRFRGRVHPRLLRRLLVNRAEAP